MPDAVSGRLTSAVFVSAIIRRVNGAGGFAAVLRRGADEAGVIFICVLERTGGATLYGQAPQSVFAEQDKPTVGGRLFECLGTGLSPQDLDARFEREGRLDPDFWVVELELYGQQIGDIVDIAPES
ncbi:MAG: DUF1491 family protein [Oricola sp.]